MNWIEVKARDGNTYTINIEKITYVGRDTIHLDDKSQTWVVTVHSHDEIIDAIKRANLGTRVAVV